jgi:hypothetical protein
MFWGQPDPHPDQLVTSTDPAPDGAGELNDETGKTGGVGEDKLSG